LEDQASCGMIILAWVLGYESGRIVSNRAFGIRDDPSGPQPESLLVN